VLPQLARPAKTLPVGERWAYEPKWDGFRAIAFVDGDEIQLQSRSGKDLGRYFPELEFASGRAVLDGELVILDDAGAPDFETLQQRIHPARSRIERLAAETPARFVVFDVLAVGGDLLLDRPFAERRAFLPEVVGGSVVPTPFATAVEEAEPWLHGAEGVIAKQLDAPYRPGERTGW
jgi:ATP-dependent DNA ligase